MIIKVKNELDKISQKTFLTTAVNVGGTSLPVKNVNGFFASWGIQVGKTGEEKSEIGKLHTAAVSGTAINLAGTLRFDHPVDTVIYATKFDQIIFKRSTSGTAGTATAMSDGTVNITPDSEYTVFDDTSGATTYAYKVAYFNSVLNITSNDSDWITPSGYSFYSLVRIRERIERKLPSNKFISTKEVVNDWINEWLEKMTTTAIDVNQDYLLGTVDVAHGTNGFATITSTDYKDVRKVDYTTNGSDYHRASKIYTTDFAPDETFSETTPKYYFFGDNVIAKKPDGAAGTARIIYYKRPTILTNDADEIPLSMQSYTKSFVDYGLAQAYYLDDKEGLGDRYMGFANGELDSFRSEISPRGKSDQELITFTEVIDADDSLEFFG